MPKNDVAPGGAGAEGAPEEEVRDVGGPEVADGPAKARWTIMLYQASDNDLSEDSIRALTETRKVPTADDIHVIAQLDPNNPRMPTRRLVINAHGKKNRQAVLGEDGQGTAATGRPGAAGGGEGRGQLGDDSARGGIKPGKIRFKDDDYKGGRDSQAAALRMVTQSGSKERGDQETDTANPETLFDLVSWSQEHFPADHYMLVLSGHSSGVETGFLLKDQNPTGSMSFKDLKTALRKIDEKLERIDIIGMDSCLINMVEIGYELKDVADIMIGAQSRVPAAGWPYREIVEEMKTRIDDGAAPEPEDVARLVVEKYIDFYSEKSAVGGLSVDLAAVRLGADAEGAAAAVKSLAGLMRQRLSDREDTGFRDDLILSHWEAQSFGGELYVDLLDFSDLLARRYRRRQGEGEMPQAFEHVRAAVEAMVIRSCFIGVDFQHANGISIYFPWSSIFTGYADLDFAAAGVSDWLSFLNDYVTGTRRATRGEDDSAVAAGGSGGDVTADPDPDLTLKANFRDDPPWKETAALGLYGRVRSMRNPPVDHPKKVEACKDEEAIKRLFRSFTTQLS